MPTSTKPPPQRPKKVFQKTRAAESQLRADLLASVYPAGRWLSKELVGERLGLNPMTLKPIFARLAQEGLLVEKVWDSGRATYYVPERRPTSAETRASVALDGETQGLGPPSEWEVANRLRAGLGSKYPLGSLMPTQTDLATEMGTSQPIVWRAFRTLRGEGLIEGGSGKRANVRALPTRPPSTPSPEPSDAETAQALALGPSPQQAVASPGAVVPSKRQTVLDYLKKAILSEEFPPYSTLPSRDVLQANLGVSAGTIDYVIARLEGMGYVEKQPGSSAVVLSKEERKARMPEVSLVEQYPAPVGNGPPAGALIPAGEVMPIIQVLYDENRRLMAGEAEAKKSGTEVAQLQKRVEGLEAQVRTDALEMADLRRQFHDVDQQNANLRGELHRRTGSENGRNVIRSFGPEFKNSLGMSDADATRLKSLIQTKKLMETAKEQ